MKFKNGMTQNAVVGVGVPYDGVVAPGVIDGDLPRPVSRAAHRQDVVGVVGVGGGDRAGRRAGDERVAGGDLAAMNVAEVRGLGQRGRAPGRRCQAGHLVERHVHLPAVQRGVRVAGGVELGVGLLDEGHPRLAGGREMGVDRRPSVCRQPRVDADVRLLAGRRVEADGVGAVAQRGDHLPHQVRVHARQGAGGRHEIAVGQGALGHVIVLRPVDEQRLGREIGICVVGGGARNGLPGHLQRHRSWSKAGGTP